MAVLSRVAVVVFFDADMLIAFGWSNYSVYILLGAIQMYSAEEVVAAVVAYLADEAHKPMEAVAVAKVLVAEERSDVLADRRDMGNCKDQQMV